MFFKCPKNVFSLVMCFRDDLPEYKLLLPRNRQRGAGLLNVALVLPIFCVLTAKGRLCLLVKRRSSPSEVTVCSRQQPVQNSGLQVTLDLGVSLLTLT